VLLKVIGISSVLPAEVMFTVLAALNVMEPLVDSVTLMLLINVSEPAMVKELFISKAGLLTAPIQSIFLAVAAALIVTRELVVNGAKLKITSSAAVGRVVATAAVVGIAVKGVGVVAGASGVVTLQLSATFQSPDPPAAPAPNQ
jgi:hypothetical protein